MSRLRERQEIEAITEKDPHRRPGSPAAFLPAGLLSVFCACLVRGLRIRAARGLWKQSPKHSPFPHADIPGRRPSPRVKHFRCPSRPRRPGGTGGSIVFFTSRRVSEMYRGRPSLQDQNGRRGALLWVTFLGHARKVTLMPMTCAWGAEKEHDHCILRRLHCDCRTTWSVRHISAAGCRCGRACLGGSSLGRKGMQGRPFSRAPGIP